MLPALLMHAVSSRADPRLPDRACVPPYDTFPFCSTDLSLEARVDDLIGRLRDEEIPPLLTAREGGGGSPGPPGNISRLGLPEYDWGVNCIHGVQTTCVKREDGTTACPTSFPNPNALGATFNESLWYKMGAAMGLELRALWLRGSQEASPWSGRPHAGLDCWSPNININRDPRWGRNQEVPSEDPHTNGRFGVAYTRGLQRGNDPRFLQAVVTLKHWDAYSLEDADGYTRHNFDARVSEYDLASTYMPAFRASVVEGRATGVMCSYNAVNGVPACASTKLNATLRGEWGFDGYVSSDTGAVSDIYKEHKYVADGPAAACAALRGGTDIDSGSVYHDHLLAGVAAGHCTMGDVRAALRRTLGLRFRLGLFDPINGQPYWHVPLDVVASDEHVRLNLDAARQSIVLLKNGDRAAPEPSAEARASRRASAVEGGATTVLPLARGVPTALIGPHVQAREALVGNYLGELCPSGFGDFSCVQSPAEAIGGLNGGNVVTAAGSAISAPIAGGVAAAVSAATASARVVLLLGIDGHVEGESNDRTSIDLPDAQRELAAAILELGKPTVIVLINGGSVAIAEEAPRADAIVEAFYPGYLGARAIAETLFGANPHCCGRMPYTIYKKDYVGQVKMGDMAMAPDAARGTPGRTYRYFTGTPIWPFGFGLGLTTFELLPANGAVGAFGGSRHRPPLQIAAADLAAWSLREASEALTFGATVCNNGGAPGDTVVFAYVELPSGHPSQEVRRLVRFQRIHLEPARRGQVAVTLSADAFAIADATGVLAVEPGEYTVRLTLGAADEASGGLARTVIVRGDRRVAVPPTAGL